MIDYANVTLTVFDYSGNRVGVLYAPGIRTNGQAQGIRIESQSNGWKQLSFSINKMVDGEENPLIEYLINEYNIVVDDGVYTDDFIISEPSIDHNGRSLSIDVRCNHISSRLRMKKLYLMFDDTNGVGKCNDLAEIILAGTGWTLGTVDKFYEPNVTPLVEKIRTLSSAGKEGAYQLLNKVCDLFNARPVFHGHTKVVDIVAFAPHSFVAGMEYPTLYNPESLIELNYSKRMSGIKRTLNTENLITRMYVEGDFGDDGYVGIESVNPTGMNFILNFDYFKNIGLFDETHEELVAQYLVNLKALRLAAQTSNTKMSEYQTELARLWGTADYSLYDITNVVSGTPINKVDVSHVTSLTDTIDIVTGQAAIMLTNDGKHTWNKVADVSGSRVTLETDLEIDKTYTSILIYRALASGTIGGKEVAVEAAEDTIDMLMARTGDNLIVDSDAAISSTQYLIKRYTLTEDWEVGRNYTLSIWGTCNGANKPRAYRDSGETGGVLLPEPTYDTIRRCWIITFECPAGTLAGQRTLSIYNIPVISATLGSIQKIKLEFGELPTPWSPAADSSNSALLAEYNLKVTTLYNGTADTKGIYELTTTAIDTARLLQAQRTAYSVATSAITTLESVTSDTLGDLLRDGYWQDSNYVIGQEASLYSDAVDVLKVMSMPVAEYDISFLNMVGVDAAQHLDISVNSSVHIIDDVAGINAWGYIEQIVYVLDEPHKNTIKISTQEAKFAGQSFTQILSQVAETAKEIKSKQGVYSRAALINNNGTISSTALEGNINVEVNKLLSNTSNWSTDANGNIVFVSQDESSAMMLTGEGFMIADGKDEQGDWDWRTMGTGRGLIADEIVAGTLRAGVVKILGTDQFYWDADNIYIFDPAIPTNQIRIGRYDGVNYGIGFTKDDGVNWQSVFGFDGINLSYVIASNIGGMSDYLTVADAGDDYTPIGDFTNLNTLATALDTAVRRDITFNEYGITIASKNSEGKVKFSARFDDQALTFLEDGNEMASFSNRSLHVDRVIASTQFSVGSLMWYSNGDGSVVAKWYTPT